MKCVIALLCTVGLAVASYQPRPYGNSHGSHGNRGGYSVRRSYGNPGYGGGYSQQSYGYGNSHSNNGYQGNNAHRGNSYGHSNNGYGHSNSYQVNTVHHSSSGYGQSNQHNQGYANSNQHNQGYGHRNQHSQGYGKPQQSYTKVTYQKHTYKSKSCYQCAYSPPKTYYDKKVVVEQGHYQHQQHNGYGNQHYGNQGGYGNKNQGSYGGSYTKKTVHPVPYTVYGGWDKCMGPFSHYQAKDYGVDVWDCHNNCYTRKDKNGDIFRGCYKGEFGVNPNRIGCHKQAGATWCFCKGDKCNNGPAPY